MTQTTPLAPSDTWQDDIRVLEAEAQDAVMGHDVVTDPPDDMVSRRRYTNIWQWRDGRWQFIARHAQIVSREPNPRSAG